jgi:two-component system OmpR family sensor kinase
MDGLKRRLNASIQFKLSIYLSLVILLVAVIAGIFSFVTAFDEAHELQDDTLRQVAALFDRQRLLPVQPGAENRPVGGDEESRVTVQHLTGLGPPLGDPDKGSPLGLPDSLADGLQTLEVSGETFRVLIKTTAIGERIAVAQETGVRDEIARNSALRTLLPILILFPVLLLIVADLIRKMFRPIATLSAEIDRRSEQQLHPVNDAHLPDEVRPFVVAINRLLARVARSLEAQRRFVADAAHELRSPLTVISLQAERLADTQMSDPARERLLTLRRGIDRGRNLLDQLLTLARSQTTSALPKSSVSIRGSFRQVLEDLLPLAEAKAIDIGLDGEEDYEVWVIEADMVALVRNLVDNAIRYTQDGGRIDVSVASQGSAVALRIRDNGPGIPLEERERVFDPFYRTPGSEQVGSGLGLSIVKTIAERIGAEIRLEFTDPAKASGLCVCVVIPATEIFHG